jgi:tetratricopeptide (TPR) repeat protein
MDVYRQLVTVFPDSFIGHFFLGKIYLGKGNLEAAEREFNRTLELNSNLEEPRFELLKIYRKQDRNEDILFMYEDILDKSPNHLRAAMELGYFLHQQGKGEKARAIFQELGARSVSNQNVIRKFVQLYVDKKKYAEAVVVIEGMLSGAPDSSDLHYVAGVVNDAKEAKEKALMHFKKVRPDSRFYPNAAVQIAFLYQGLGKTDEAIEHLKAVVEKYPKDSELLRHLGWFYGEIEAFEKAEEALKRGLAIDPKNAKIYFRLGVIYDKWGNKPASIEAMKKVIALDPKNANALNYLGYTYADLGRNLDEAEELIKKALEYKPDDGYITDSLGWVYYKKGMYEKALEMLEKAVSLIPDDPVILEHLGDVYLKLNAKEKALEYYQRSILHQKKDKDKLILEKKIQELSGKGF